MSDRSSSPNFLRPWRAVGVPVDGHLQAALRERTTLTIAATIQASASHRQRRRYGRMLLVAAGVAVAGLAGYGVWERARTGPEAVAQAASLPSPQSVEPQVQPSSRIDATHVVGTVMLDSRGAPSILGPHGSVELSVGDALTTPKDGSVTIELADRGQVEVGPATEISLVKDSAVERRFHLRAGKVDVDIAKLQPERRLVLDTPDAEVTVVGTAFEVEVTEQAGSKPGTRTAVRVRRGVVHVARHGRAGVLIRGGESWDSEPTLRPPPGPRPAGNQVGTLEAENRLYRAALNARNSGNDRQAVGLLERFLDKYPNAVMAQEARLELSRARTRLADPR